MLKTVTPALNLAGYEVTYRKINIETAKCAKEYHFYSSPTIRVNGQDICGPVKENPCDCCSDISGTAVDFRLFEYHGESYEIPPKEMLAQVILKTVFSGFLNHGYENYVLPDNLKRFFEGKQKKSKCSCNCDCR